MNALEVVAAMLGLINIVLVVRRSVWNFPFGLAMVALYGWLFAQPDVRLYSDAGLQIFFFVVQLYGWWSWSQAEAEAGEIVPLRLPVSARITVLGGIVLATVSWGALMHRFTDASLPWWDAFIAMTSVAAQLLMARRFVENWVLWIAVDIVAIGVYSSKGLMLTGFLYFAFLILSAVGLIGWQRALARDKQQAASA